MAKSVSLDDKYRAEEGRIYLSSIQALVRVLLDQARRDRVAGLNTAGFVSGYRGSPIGTFDSTLWGLSGILSEYNVRFMPGLNEELAATAVRGSQELTWYGKASVDSVFGMWYGKGVGADRGQEALKLGNLEGAAANGGVLAVVGDDHGGKSSVSSHQSEQVLIAALMPILYPAGTAEILEFGLFGYALSRFSGLYVALKCVTDTLDLASSVALSNLRHVYAQPSGLILPEGGLNLRPAVAQLAQEDMVVNHRLPASQAFVRANGIDRVVIDAEDPRLTIVSAGKAYLDMRQALADLGFDEAKCRARGIRIYKPGLIWPLDPVSAVAAARGTAEIFVVEEKRPVIQDQLAAILFGQTNPPRLFGKCDEQGMVLLPSNGELNPSLVRAALMRRLRAIGLSDDDTEARYRYFEETKQHVTAVGTSSLIRPAFFCSGCPHNTSTRVPEGSRAMGATGCHAMPAYMPGSTTMRPMTMGAEGMPWLGVSHLIEVPHMFQNMGDGTYAHSGVLAIRAAVAAKANLTYKILYNDAVAMTGGQPIEGAPSPYDIVKQLLAERVKPVAVVYDQAENFDPALLPPGVKAYPRGELDSVQRMFRQYKGISGIVYVQTCAAEKRRRRKRGKFPDPDKRVFINAAVCEGCGDCSVQSNCISIQPLETEFGRKRLIDQSSCNKDFSCVKGFCPSFVTVEGAKIARVKPVADTLLAEAAASLPKPAIAPIGNGSYNVLVTGIGGTGVLTVGAILGMAAHLDGRGCTVMDMTGMAQKGGAVTSHIRIAATPDEIFNARLDLGMADALIACDLIVAAAADVLKTIKPDRTRAIFNSNVASTGEFARNPKLDLDEHKLEAIIREALGTSEPATFAATDLAVNLTGDAIATNMLMLGYAAQLGLLPVSVEALEQAIRLNGTAVDANLRVFTSGRIAAVAPEKLPVQNKPVTPVFDDSLDGVLASRTALLEKYQDRAYAQRYLDFVTDITKRVRAKSIAGADLFMREVALSLGKLMAYKDEYEVARLYADPAFTRALKAQFSGNFKITYNLAPPILPGIDPATKRPKKRQFGSSMGRFFHLLQRFKFLRGTAFDPFGYTHERRTERAQIEEYRALVSSIADRIDANNIDAAIELAGAAQDIRGYGPVKDASTKAYAERRDQLMQTFNRHNEIRKLEEA